MRALVSWVLFDWAAQPFYTLILTFLFAPFFASVVVGDPVRGQALWGYAAAAAGILIAAGSPLLGALADGRGRRKPWIALFSLIFVGSLTALWLAAPSSPTLVLAAVLLAVVSATVAVEFATVFTNAMMPGLVPPQQLGRLSGAGWAVGYAGGLVSLAVTAGLLVADPNTGKTLLGLDPAYPLDAASRESDRLAGPFAALWYVVFMLPFFLFVPDSQGGKPQPMDRARSAFAELWDTIRTLPSHRDMLLFLLARMLYADGLSAIFLFGGIYGAAVFGWAATDLAVFGLIIIVTGIIGALVGGIVDDRVGSKTVILVSLLLIIAGAAGLLSIDSNHVLFTTEVTPKAPGSKPFTSTGELVFLAFAVLVGLAAAPVQAASRALLARLAPPEKVTQFFGLFAFSGKVTAFMAPFLVATVTALSGSQRIGMASIIAFLLLGILLMLPVRAPAPQ